MQIDHVYERDRVFVVFPGPESIGMHYSKDSPEGEIVRAHIIEHQEALIPEPVPPEPTAEQKAARALAVCITQRKAAYQAESDPIFWDVQLGKINIEVWRKKNLEIKDRYPKPE